MQSNASMGPPPDNGGYDSSTAGCIRSRIQKLQWVHRPITVVMDEHENEDDGKHRKLQWVHRPITVVMVTQVTGLWLTGCFNGSTAR